MIEGNAPGAGGFSHESETKGDGKRGWEGDKDATELDNRVEMMPRVNRRAFWSAWASGRKLAWNRRQNREGAAGGLSDGGAVSARCFHEERINQTFRPP